MTIGAIGAYSFQPYIYNTNTVSAASMNKLSKISDDVLDRKIDFSELTDKTENENPLKKGQTLDFQSMLESQMAKGQMNAARVMKPAQETQATAAVSQDEETAQTAVSVFTDQADAVETQESAQVVTPDFAAAGGESGYSSYQMQQAVSAYEMMMTA